MNARDWDRLAAAYDDEVCDIFTRDRKQVIARWLRARGLSRGGRTVVDAGCGIGSFFKKYGRHFGRKTGTDHSQRMLQIAAVRCRGLKDCHWLRADIRSLPSALARSADLVVCANVLTFVSPLASQRALRRVVRCARPGGWVMLVLPSLESHDAIVALETGRARPNRGHFAIVRRDDRMQRFYTRAGALRLAAGARLRFITVRKVWYPLIDEGVTRAPRGHEQPWDWLITGRH